MKIAWDCGENKAITFDESHYLSLADLDALDAGVYDFAVELLFKWDSSVGNPGTAKLLVSKSPGALAGTEKGWQVLLLPSTSSLVVRFNDGNASILEKTYTGVAPSNTDLFFRLEFDRDGKLHLYKDGALADDTFDISGRPNSVDNSAALRVGHQDGESNDYLKGQVSLLRLDFGPGLLRDSAGTVYYTGAREVDYGSAWNLANYYKLKYGWPLNIEHYLVAWYFSESLTDSSIDKVALTFNGGGSPSYATSWPIYFSYVFHLNPVADRGMDQSHADLDAKQRTLDGTLRYYSLTTKRTASMYVRATSIEQVIALQGAFMHKAPVYVFEADGLPYSWKGFFYTPPIVTTAAKNSAVTIWEIELDLEEE